MGLLDQIGSAVSGATGKGTQTGANAMLLQQLIAMLSKPGALESVLGAFRAGGLGNVVQSWIGTGQNLPISADQVRAVLGKGTVSDLAQKSGMAEPEAANALSGLLPGVIDKLTPDGKSPAGLDASALSGALGKLLG